MSYISAKQERIERKKFLMDCANIINERTNLYNSLYVSFNINEQFFMDNNMWKMNIEITNNLINVYKLIEGLK